MAADIKKDVNKREVIMAQESEKKKPDDKEKSEVLSRTEAGAIIRKAAQGAEATPLELERFQEEREAREKSSIDMLMDVSMNVKIELGRTKMNVEDILRLGEGSIVELDKLAGDPVNILVNDRLVARGEVLVLNDNFCVRVTEIIKSDKK